MEPVKKISETVTRAVGIFRAVYSLDRQPEYTLLFNALTYLSAASTVRET